MLSEAERMKKADDANVIIQKVLLVTVSILQRGT